MTSSQATQVNRQAAASWLASKLPQKSPEQWAHWLRDNANQSRPASYRVPSSKIGRHAFYDLADLEAFVRFEKEITHAGVKLTGRAAEAFHAFGIGTPSGTPYGRKWKGGYANPSTRDDGDLFVQTGINEPKLVFAMTPDEAIEFGRELLEAGEQVKRTGAAT